MNITDRVVKNYKTEVNLVRCFVKHFSFVTALQSALNGGQDTIGVNVILNANIYEGVRVKNPMMFSAFEEAPYHNVLEGSLFQCCDLLSWIGGTYDSKELQEGKLNGPTEFTIETWICGDNELKWQLVRKTHWGGVKWLDAAHTGDGGDRACAGVATFVCSSKKVEEIANGEVVTLVKALHPTIELRRVLQESLPSPKHSANYLG